MNPTPLFKTYLTSTQAELLLVALARANMGGHADLLHVVPALQDIATDPTQPPLTDEEADLLAEMLEGELSGKLCERIMAEAENMARATARRELADYREYMSE